jgi:hypothetical protein
MTTSTKCRAKNPSTCRVHGSPNVRMNALMSPQISYNNLLSSQKKTALATNLEELAEAKEFEFHDITAYNATLSGLEDLKKASYHTETFADKLKNDALIKEAVEYRASVLRTSPVFQESENTFNSFVKENAKHSYEITTLTDRDEMRDVWGRIGSQTPVGTPIAIRTKSGNFIYDTAGNGYIDAKLPKLAKLFGDSGSFLRHDTATPFYSLKNAGRAQHGDEIAEIHILKPGTEAKFGNLANSHTISNNPKSYQEQGRHSISGDGFHYEIEGISKATPNQSGYGIASGSNFYYVTKDRIKENGIFSL